MEVVRSEVVRSEVVRPETVTTPVPSWTPALAAPPKRDLWLAMKRGLRGRCPNCGDGKLFKAFLKTADRCTACGQDFSHHRADDLPAYLVIIIVGHIVVPLALWIETDYAPSIALQLGIYLPVTLFASLALLQPVKGAVVGLQWAFRMHGFGDEAAKPAPVSEEAITKSVTGAT